ncbi:MAG: NUDIX domain-containing protein [Cytophagales bacterium]|nr:MAG: NUDIX domain-containing protein [Cytophagales bacterium]
MEIYKHKYRVRVCGICIDEQQILLVKQEGLAHIPYLWIAPGGGLEFGETLQEALKREFFEETTLEAEIGNLLFTNQYVAPPFHAVEFFFQVKIPKEKIKKRYFPPNEPSLAEVRWLDIAELNEIPNAYKHKFLRNINSVAAIKELPNLLP